MSKLPDWIKALDEQLGVDITTFSTTLNDKTKRRAINLALKEYSKHKPRIVSEKVDGADTFEYKLSTSLTLYIEDFTVVTAVEYPVDDTYQTPNILIPKEEWDIYKKPTTDEYLRFINHAPTASEDIRITHSTLHTVSVTGTSTVSNYDEEAVQALAVSYLCKFLSAYFTPNSDSSIAADSVDHKSKRAEYMSLSKAFRQIYMDHMGLKEKDTIKPASVNFDWDLKGSWASDKLTHKGRYR